MCSQALGPFRQRCFWNGPSGKPWSEISWPERANSSTSPGAHAYTSRVVLIFLLLPNAPWWLLLTLPGLMFVGWLDLRTLELRAIVTFWWLLLVLLLFIPGWIALKIFATMRRRRLA